MRHVLSTHLFVNHRLTTALLDRISSAGIGEVEIFCARQHLDYRNRSQLAEIGHWFRDAKLKMHALHSPIYNDEVWGRSGPQSVVNITEPVKGKRIQAVDEIKRALEIAEVVPFRYLIQHLGGPDEEYGEAKLDAAFSSLDELRLFAGGRGVQILLENIPNGLSSAEGLTAFLRMTHLDLGFCFDTGHANLTGHLAQEFELMQDRVRSTHVHDNDGQTDSHLVPFSEGGTIDWTAAMKLLAARPEQYPLVLELKETPEMDNPIGLALETWKRLESVV